MVTALAEVGDQSQFTALQVLDSAPGEVRGLRTGAASKIAFIDQSHLDAARGEGGGRNGAINASAQNNHVEMALGELANVVLTQA